ncbi:MAG TPA: ATP-binding protein [Puia sp.]|nr:ATP-binding protein [Puia sp.]
MHKIQRKYVFPHDQPVVIACQCSAQNPYGNKIFELFQRLHPKSGYTGTGIGLTICKKIIRNNKGFINATGDPGIGSVFSIFIPVNES